MTCGEIRGDSAANICHLQNLATPDEHGQGHYWRAIRVGARGAGKGIPVRSLRIGEGKPQDGFVAQEVEGFYPRAVAEVEDEPTTAPGPGTHKALLPLALIPPLFRAVQEQDERILQHEKEVAALNEIASTGLGSQSSVFSSQSSDSSLQSPASSLQTLADAEILRLTESVLRKMGIEPWVEITPEEAWEEVDETTQQSGDTIEWH